MTFIFYHTDNKCWSEDSGPGWVDAEAHTLATMLSLKTWLVNYLIKQVTVTLIQPV
jgi:hypothetical protein